MSGKLFGVFCVVLLFYKYTAISMCISLSILVKRHDSFFLSVYYPAKEYLSFKTPRFTLWHEPELCVVGF